MHFMSVSMVMIINTWGMVRGSNRLDPAVSWAAPGRTEGSRLPAAIERNISKENAAFCRVRSWTFYQLGVEPVVQYCIILLKAARCDSMASGGAKCKTSILWGTTASVLTGVCAGSACQLRCLPVWHPNGCSKHCYVIPTKVFQRWSQRSENEQERKYS